MGEDGATHQCLEDMALMRSIPGMVVICPADGNETRQAVLTLNQYEGPAYLRIGRAAVETVTDFGTASSALRAPLVLGSKVTFSGT